MTTIMKTTRPYKLVLFFAILLTIGMGGGMASAQDEFVIIANADVPVETIDKSSIKRIYNGFTTQWKNANKVKPCYMNIADEAFWKYMGTSKVNFQKFWTKRVFSGNGVSPIEHKTSADLVKYVNEIPGAIGILKASDKNLVQANTKVLKLSN